MIETYAERLQKRKENTMTNYDMDEIERLKEREKRSRGIKPENTWPQSVKIGKNETLSTAVDIELPDDDFMRIAREAHERDITFNKMVGIMLKDGLQSVEDGFEHDIKPQLLNEDK